MSAENINEALHDNEAFIDRGLGESSRCGNGACLEVRKLNPDVTDAAIREQFGEDGYQIADVVHDRVLGSVALSRAGIIDFVQRFNDGEFNEILELESAQAAAAKQL